MPDSPMTPEIMDLAHDVVMGHEFAAEVVEPWARTSATAREGDIVVSMPVVFDAARGPSARLLQRLPRRLRRAAWCCRDLLALKVPNGLEPRRAALTEPMAVGLHAVNKSRIQPGMSAVVLGCGPVGLAVIAALRLHGRRATSSPPTSPPPGGRWPRPWARTRSVDPRDEPAVDAWRRSGARRAPRHLRGGRRARHDRRRHAAPPPQTPHRRRRRVHGARHDPPHARHQPELSMQFVLGYDPMEFADMLRHIAEGEIDVDPLITGSVGIDGVPGAFEDLADPECPRQDPGRTPRPGRDAGGFEIGPAPFFVPRRPENDAPGTENGHDPAGAGPRVEGCRATRARCGVRPGPGGPRRRRTRRALRAMCRTDAPCVSPISITSRPSGASQRQRLSQDLLDRFETGRAGHQGHGRLPVGHLGRQRIGGRHVGRVGHDQVDRAAQLARQRLEPVALEHRHTGGPPPSPARLAFVTSTAPGATSTPRRRCRRVRRRATSPSHRFHTRGRRRSAAIRRRFAADHSIELAQRHLDDLPRSRAAGSAPAGRPAGRACGSPTARARTAAARRPAAGRASRRRRATPRSGRRLVERQHELGAVVAGRLLDDAPGVDLGRPATATAGCPEPLDGLRQQLAPRSGSRQSPVELAGPLVVRPARRRPRRARRPAPCRACRG